MIKKDTNKRLVKKASIRKKITGTSEKPRFAVFRSLANIYVQIIDDTKGETLVAASTLTKELADQLKDVTGKANKSAVLGEYVGKLAVEKGISKVVFDRSGYRYHGRVKAVADGARKGGLDF